MDTLGAGQNFGFQLNFEGNNYVPEGWFNEGSVASIIYDIFDNINDGPDTISVGLGPIFRAMTSTQFRTTPEAISIFAFIDAMLSQPEINAGDITPLLTTQSITSMQSDAVGETNDGGVPTVLPVYKTLTVGGPPATACSVNDIGTQNRLGNFDFVRFSVPSPQNVTISVTRTSGASSTDPDFLLFRSGIFLRNANGTANNSESTSINLSAGEHLLVVTDFNNDDGTGFDACFDVRVQ